MKGYVAIDSNGAPRMYTLAHTKGRCMARATETMMGASEYHALPDTSARWQHCYRRGCRIVKVNVTLAVEQAAQEGRG